MIADKKGDILVDKVGRYENLEADTNEILDRIGVQCERLSRINATKHTHYSEYYTPETRDLVREKWAREIELFGYRFNEE